MCLDLFGLCNRVKYLVAYVFLSLLAVAISGEIQFSVG